MSGSHLGPWPASLPSDSGSHARRVSLRSPPSAPTSSGADLRRCPLRVSTEHGVDVIRVQPEDAAAPVHGEDALGDSAADGLHADPDASSGRGQGLIGSHGHGAVPFWAQAGLKGHQTSSTYSSPQPLGQPPWDCRSRFLGECEQSAPVGAGLRSRWGALTSKNNRVDVLLQGGTRGDRT